MITDSTLLNSLPLTVCDMSLTRTQFCAVLKTVLFCSTFVTVQSVTNAVQTQICFTYLLTYLLIAEQKENDLLV